MNNTKSLLNKMLNFDTMITPIVIKILYFINVVVVVLVGLVSVFQGLNSRYGGGLQVFIGLLVIVIGPFVIRMSYELLIVIFKINENIDKIANKKDYGFDIVD